MKNVLLVKKWVGEGFPCYTVAEIGGLFKNFEEAKRLINNAIEIGVDAVKFQTLEAETITSKKNYFDMEVTGKVSQYDFFRKFEPSKDLQVQVVKYANKCEIPIFSAPSHMKDLELMKKIELPIYKIGSDLACHIPLLKEVAKLGKPIILSTGMCTIQEVRDSVEAILSVGNDQLILMHCVSDYPAKVGEANLNAIYTMKREFNLPVGFSDHTEGSLVIQAAAIMGANIIEKHFRDIRNSPSPDDLHSLTKEEFGKLIRSIRDIEKAKGDGNKIPTFSESRNLLTNRVSMIAAMDIVAGSVVTDEMIDIKRPGTGIQPIHYSKVIGRKAKVNISSDDPITWEMLS